MKKFFADFENPYAYALMEKINNGWYRVEHRKSADIVEKTIFDTRSEALAEYKRIIKKD